jgi:hypothetical protein
MQRAAQRQRKTKARTIVSEIATRRKWTGVDDESAVVDLPVDDAADDEVPAGRTGSFSYAPAMAGGGEIRDGASGL